MKQLTFWGDQELSGAIFSEDHKYRVADAMYDDPTIRRLIKFTKAEQFGGFYILNLFTYISTDPHNLLLAKNPMYMANDYIYEYQAKTDKIVFMWGNNKVIKDRAKEVIDMFPGAYCFGKNKDGSPKHPLYLPKISKLILFEDDAEIECLN
jgi:hypothetical protein